MTRDSPRPLPLAVVVALLLGVGGAASAQGPLAAAPDFDQDVKPILAAACVRCHSAALPQGLLRLDSREGFLKGGAGGPVVAAGDPDRSSLVSRLTHPDPAKRMPWMSEALKPKEIDTLRRWVAAGASWPEGSTVGVAIAAPAPTAPASLASGARRDPSRLHFNRDVRPILSDNCYGCHGPDRNRRQMGLRLDREDAAKETLPSGRVAVAAGKPEESEILRRILDPLEERRMPHLSSGKPRLTAAQVATLRRWIEEGAEWEPHWAYIPPVRPEPPAVKAAGWVRGPVDAFLLQAMEVQGLRPSPEASRRELLRRLSVDLTGVPPTPEEVRRFESDRGQDAYEREVQRLLASPRFGERMAAYWLDLVRYSDSVGYHSDNARPMWRYRDYVVSAFNRNLPFDRFTEEQLAGDLLPGAGFEQKVASGYNRLLQTTEEGGAQPREYRAIYLADRVRNASTVWLGSTLGCAQCHDHKFDPFSAKDFYSFGAFFADVTEKPVGRRQPDYLPDESQRARLDAAEAEVKAAREALEAEVEARVLARAAWEKALAGRRVPRFTTLEPVEAASAKGTRVMIQGNDFSIIASTSHGPKPPEDTYTVRFTTALQGLTALRLEALTFEELPEGGPGRGPNGGFVVSEMEVRDAEGRPLALRNASASTPDDPAGLRGAAQAIDGRADTGWTLAAADGEGHRLVVELKDPLGSSGETSLTLVLRQQAGHLRTLGRFRLAGTTETLPVRTEPGPEPGGDLVAIAATEPVERTKEQGETLVRFWRRAAPELAEARARLRAAELGRQAFLETVPSAFVSAAQAPEDVRVLPRGNWLDESGELAPPAVPHFLPPLPAAAGPPARATRLDLARWLTAKENPLTARVFVNRLFRLYFGQGLSRTLEDLGSQGEWPTHPELLDWLAVEFADRGWDVKHMVRTLVTSAAYRQSSRTTPALLEKDPHNRFYARQNRMRLDAEAVRDNALFVSGLLSPKMGGPSVHPYQPLGYWAYLNFPPREWDASPGEDQYRRGLYTWWQRAFPQPSLVAFDAPSREECVADRVRSNVPQQALVLLNDPTYVEAARVFAARVLREGGSTVEARLRYAFARALQRSPSPEETRTLAALLERSRARFARDEAAARALVGTGQAAAPPRLRPVELAAWTQVTRAILNLPELITRS